MTLFAPPAVGAQTEPADGHDAQIAPVRRPRRWSVRNWPVRRKVLAIALVPMLLAMVFGGLRIAGAMGDVRELQRAADRTEMAPPITDYMAALGGVLVADAADGDGAAVRKDYQTREHELRSRLAATDVTSDVDSAVTALLDDGQALLDKTSGHDIALPDVVTSYAPLLLNAEDAIDASVRVDSERIRAQAQGLSRAVGARGQMTMQKLLVNGGGELPEGLLRTSMATLAGTEPSTLSGMSQVLGVGSPEANELHRQYVQRMAIIADPAIPLAGNPELLASIRTTDALASRVVNETVGSLTASVKNQATDRRNAAIRDTALVLAAIVTALVVVFFVARSLVRPLRTLRAGALKVAHTDLEDEISRVRAGDVREPAPLPVYTTEEIGQVAHAVDELHAQALLLAGDEARLRALVNDMFETMARRNRSLVDQQLSLIDELERNEDDPDRLDSLFRLDHLATRMRRNGANLLALAGTQGSHDQGRPVPLSTVVEAAVSEVEDYRRVQTITVPDVTVAGAVIGDTVHLLAELMDNALRYSPPTAPIRVSAVHAADAGVLIRISDTGLGMTAADLRMANMRLRSGAEVSPENTRHMGLFVVGLLAQRHRIRVRLRPTGEPDPGITAEVYLRPGLLVGDTDPRRGPTPAAEADAARPGEPVAPEPADGPRSASPWWEPADPGGQQAPAPARPGPQSDDDLIYQRMLSESLSDPHQLGRSRDLDWKSVWDHGWSVAAEAEQVPVADHTDGGLPVRDPGARLIPGAAASSEGRDAPDRRDGAADDQPQRDPEAIRASMSSHFGGVRAARSHARNQGVDQ